MGPSFQRIAYETLEVCNGVEMSAIERMLAQTGLPPGARAADVGTGNAGVAIRMAAALGLDVAAIEFDPDMAELARARIAAAAVDDRIELTIGPAHRQLPPLAPLDLIVALGTTNLTGEGRPSIEAGFDFLRRALRPRGWLLFGDIVWLGEPSAPLRQISEVTNRYADDAGWRAAARSSGLELVNAEISPPTVFDAYARQAVKSVRDWLRDHPEHPASAALTVSADRMLAIFDYGRGVIGFGLYLLRRAD